MPSADRPGKKGVYVELPEDLDEALRELVKSLPFGTLTQHIVLALRRHVANPPSVEVPELPPARVTEPEVPVKKKKTVK